MTVQSGGTLGGQGTVFLNSILDVVVAGGGTIAPGVASPFSTLNVTGTGNVQFNTGSFFNVNVNAAGQTDKLALSGTGTLTGGTVQVLAQPGFYAPQTNYTILTAGTRTGTFSGLTTNNLPAGFAASLGYGANTVTLDLSIPASATSGLPPNQQAPANAIANFFNNGGTLPPGFVTLVGLTGAQQQNGYAQVSGEVGTGSQQTTFNAMGQFMGLLTDPFMGRNGGSNPMPGATGYADEASAYAATKKTDAFAMFTKAPPAAPFEQRWSVWAAGFGGSQSTDGNAALGSNNTTSRIAGTAVGAEYLFSPNTIAGFALAGGGTNFNVANNLGSGRSDLFQAGAFVRHTAGAAYVSGALAYGWQDITTNRTVTVAGIDQLRAQFNANAWSGRLEGGYRFVTPWMGITPYAAGQFTTFDLPAYAEQAVVGSNAFALAYGAKSVTDARSELGIRTDKSFALQNGILTLRGRFAWAHDFDPDRAIAATFQALPGASFVVNGAAQASDSALTTASAEMKWMNGWSAAAIFEGEFSNVTRSYAGKGVVRYIW